MSQWAPFVSLASVIVGAVVGGVLVHRLTLQREALVVRRTQRVAFLLDAYRKLIDASERDVLSPARRDCLEAAIADIMLLGGRAEIEAAHRFEVEFAETGGASLDPVIRALRDSLRSELGMEVVTLPSPYNLRVHLAGDERPGGDGMEFGHRPTSGSGGKKG